MTFKSDYLKYLILFSLPVLGFSLYEWFYYSFNHSIYFTCGLRTYFYKSFFPQCLFFLSLSAGLLFFIKGIIALYRKESKKTKKIASFIVMMMMAFFMIVFADNVLIVRGSIFVCDTSSQINGSLVE